MMARHSIVGIFWLVIFASFLIGVETTRAAEITRWYNRIVYFELDGNSYRPDQVLDVLDTKGRVAGQIIVIEEMGFSYKARILRGRAKKGWTVVQTSKDSIAKLKATKLEMAKGSTPVLFAEKPSQAALEIENTPSQLKPNRRQLKPKAYQKKKKAPQFGVTLGLDFSDRLVSRISATVSGNSTSSSSTLDLEPFIGVGFHFERPLSNKLIFIGGFYYQLGRKATAWSVESAGTSASGDFDGDLSVSYKVLESSLGYNIEPDRFYAYLGANFSQLSMQGGGASNESIFNPSLGYQLAFVYRTLPFDIELKYRTLIQRIKNDDSQITATGSLEYSGLLLAGRYMW